jgi:mannan polymerase II complex MNN10 subunit
MLFWRHFTQLQKRLHRSIYGLLLLSCWTAASSANKQPRIAILTLSPGMLAQPYVAQTVVNKAKYATRHGYTFSLFNHLDQSRDAFWSKILAVKSAIKSRKYDWIMWLDGAVVITNFRTRIESMLPGNSSIDFVVTRDCNMINMGAFLIRASESALHTLDLIYDGPHVTNETVNHPWMDSKSFQTLYATSEQLRNRTLEVPQKTFNSYPLSNSGKCSMAGWAAADFAIHFSGTNDKRREKMVTEYLNKVIV